MSLGDKMTCRLLRDITDTDDNLVWQLQNRYSLPLPSGVHVTSLFDKEKLA